MLASVTAGDATEWAEVATRHGFFDQAHLINDFRDLTGVTPAAYEPRSMTEHNHVPVLPHISGADT